jgi:hypothetical protein
VSGIVSSIAKRINGNNNGELIGAVESPIVADP